jgi:predicted dithiol-disulfide oxidoreductase (DUF899 family)
MMSNSFQEDPFFNDNSNDQFEDYIFDEFNNHIQKMDAHFNNLCNSVFQTKSTIENKRLKQKNNSRKMNNDSNQNINSSVSRQTNSQTPQQNYFYSSRFSSYSDSNGITHMKSKVSDNINGTKMTETRGIGNQSITWKRKISKEGCVEDKETKNKIEENEKDKFVHEWEEKSSKFKYFGINNNKKINNPNSGAIQ